jgi:AsmA family protein
VENAQIDLIRDSTDRANWRFASQGKPKSSRPARLPVVRRFNLRGARLSFEDGMRELKLTSTVSADQKTSGGGPIWARLRGRGVANGEAFTLAAVGQPLTGIRPDQPYAMTFAIRASNTALDGRIRIARAFDLASLQLDFSAAGQDLADLYHLTRLALPNTAPYRLTGHIRRAGTKVDLTDLDGKVGSSDLRGTITVETANKRNKMTANLASRSLNLSDVAPAFGTRVPGARTRGAAQEKAAGTANKTGASAELLFPDARLDPKRIRAMDADVRYRAESVQAKKVPFKQVAFRLSLDDGVLTIDPVSFLLAQGRVAGSVRMDARQEVPDVGVDARLSDVRLSQFHGKGAQPALEGTLVGRALLHGRGSSVHSVVATADGTVVAVVPHGEVREAFAELTGINVTRGLGLLLTKGQEETDVRCGVAQFQSLKGTLVAKSLVFDTQDVLITGKGEIDLGSEKLDLSLNGQPKKFRLTRVRAPITVQGTLLHPSIGLKTGNTVGQGAAAVALGSLLTPLAAVLAFIDPGLAKDADCSALLNEAHQEGAPLKTASAAPDNAPAPQAGQAKTPPDQVERPAVRRR